MACGAGSCPAGYQRRNSRWRSPPRTVPQLGRADTPHRRFSRLSRAGSQGSPRARRRRAPGSRAARADGRRWDKCPRSAADRASAPLGRRSAIQFPLGTLQGLRARKSYHDKRAGKWHAGWVARRTSRPRRSVARANAGRGAGFALTRCHHQRANCVAFLCLLTQLPAQRPRTRFLSYSLPRPFTEQPH